MTFPSKRESPSGGTTSAAPARSREVVPLRHPWRWVAVIVVALIFAALVQSAAGNPNYQWAVVRHYLFAAPVLMGLYHTIYLTILSMLIGISLGIVVALMRLSDNPVISTAASLYTWFFRGVPVLVQLLFWFFLSALIPRMGIGIPFGPIFVSVPTNAVINKLGAALLGLGLSEAAYMAEIVRSGVLSVPVGQTEAAKTIGMSRLMMMWRIILPQALRIIIPPTGNETIGMLKNTTLVIVIAYTDLLTSVSIIYARNYKTIPLLIVACFWYLLVTTVLMMLQARIEKRYGRGFNPRGRQAGFGARFLARIVRRQPADGGMGARGGDGNG